MQYKATFIVPLKYNNGGPVDPIYRQQVAALLRLHFNGFTMIDRVTGESELANGNIAADESWLAWAIIDETQIPVARKIAQTIAETHAQESVYLELCPCTLELITPRKVDNFSGH